jgi:hypothetical protein
MSIKVAVLGDPLLVERVISHLCKKPRAYDLIEYQRVLTDVPPAWYIHCHHVPPNDLGTPANKSTLYVPSSMSFMVLTRTPDSALLGYVTKVNEILPRMVIGVLGPDHCQSVIEEARSVLVYHALWAFSMLIIISAFTGTEHSDDPFAIALDVLLLICWFWFVVDGIACCIRLFQGRILDSPSVQKSNGVLQRIFSVLARDRNDIV